MIHEGNRFGRWLVFRSEAMSVFTVSIWRLGQPLANGFQHRVILGITRSFGKWHFEAHINLNDGKLRMVRFPFWRSMA